MTADLAKAIADYFATMFDQESANTVKVLRAVPNDRRDYNRAPDKLNEPGAAPLEPATDPASNRATFADEFPGPGRGRVEARNPSDQS